MTAAMQISMMKLWRDKMTAAREIDEPHERGQDRDLRKRREDRGDGEWCMHGGVPPKEET
jgi:hypothetical protein